MKLFSPFSNKPFLTAASCCGLVLTGAVFSGVQAQTYQDSITIDDTNCPTAGCTRTGYYESTDPKVAAITIKTKSPVTIKDCYLRGPFNLIDALPGNANITVSNTRGYGTNPVNPKMANQQKGRFLNVEGYSNIVVKNCYLEGTTGIFMARYKGDGSINNTVTIQNNRVCNIDGRLSNGTGGYSSETDVHYVQFVQMSNEPLKWSSPDEQGNVSKLPKDTEKEPVYPLPNADISWNEIINYPKQSRVEDNINLYCDMSGTAASPIRIHDNYIQGAYPTEGTGQVFSGGGIMLSDSGTRYLTLDGKEIRGGSYVTAYNNQVISTANYGMGINGGHDNNIHDNTIISCGKLPDGTTNFTVMNVGIQIYNPSDHDPNWANNQTWGNSVGYEFPAHPANKPYYNEWYLGDSTDPLNCAAAPPTGSAPNTKVQQNFTVSREQLEWTKWLAKSNGHAIGPPSTNLIGNASFDAQGADTQTPSNWNEWGGPNGTDADASKVEAFLGNGVTQEHSGARHATHWKATPYEVKTSAYVTGLTAGRYTAKVWVCSGGGQSICRLLVTDYGGGPDLYVDVPQTSTWTQIAIPDIPVTGTHCQVQLYSKAGADQWAYFDDAELRRQ